MARALHKAQQALDKVIEELPRGSSLLDIGAGSTLVHSSRFAAAGLLVTAVDLCDVTIPQVKGVMFLKGFFEELDLAPGSFDAVWTSHVLEHIPDVHTFLQAKIALCKEGGIISVTVPPLKHAIVGGHINLFNAGIVMYRMVLAGLDMSECSIKSYGYNISVVVRKRSITIPTLKYDKGDIETLAPFFPPGMQKQNFGGNIQEHNWD